MPGMAVTSRAESKASGSEGARRLRVASGIEKRNPYPICAACAKGRRHILSGWGPHHHTYPLSDLPVAFALVDANDQPHMRRSLKNLKAWGFHPRVVVTDG